MLSKAIIWASPWFSSVIILNIDKWMKSCVQAALFQKTIQVLSTFTTHFLSKVNIWNVNCARHERVFLGKCQSFWDRKCLDLRGTRTPNLRIHAECSNLLSYQGQTFYSPMLLNTGSGGIDIFHVKLTFEMLTVRGQQHLFSTHERVFLGKCQCFESENVSTWGGFEPPIFGFMPNALTYWAITARHLLSRVVEYWLWCYRYFFNKVIIWYGNCARATAFIFDTRTGVFGKVSKFLREKMSRPIYIY